MTLSLSSPQSQDVQFFVYYGDSTVSSTNYSGTTNIVVPALQTTYKTTITGTNLQNSGIQPGQWVTIMAYPSSSSPALGSKYTDENTGRVIYTALGQPSMKQSCQVPF
jgi:hypothetical protein